MRLDDQYYYDNRERFSWCVATMVIGLTETDALFLEPYHHLDEGCVALTGPMSYEYAVCALSDMRAERAREEADDGGR